MKSQQAVAALSPAAPVASFEIYEYDVPEDMADVASGIKTVGMRLLTPRIETMAFRRVKGNEEQLAYELTKQAIVEINGERVSIADGHLDETWERMHPQIRSLVMNAYADLSTPPEGAQARFRESRRVKVG